MSTRGACAPRTSAITRFSQTELLCPADNLAQLLNLVTLLVDEQFRITDDVDEQDMSDLEFYV